MAKRVVAEAYGGPEVLSLTESDVPPPGPGEVTVRAMAIGTNPMDYKLYSGAMGDDPAALPMPVGQELAGVVTAAGEDAEGPAGPLSPGADVIAFSVPGAYATELTVPASSVVPKPPELSWEAAAGLMLAGGTAVHALTVVGAGEGETLLIHGASGGVGLLAVQIAVADGARVIGTASERRLESVERYGATAIPYGPGLLERVREAAPGGVDAVVDTSGTREAIDASLELVPDRARIVSILAFDRGDTGIKLIGGAPNADSGTEIRANAWRRLVELARQGELEVVVARRYSLAEAAEAHRFLAEGHPGGKVVLLP
ncbi:NADPH:quinone reductase-like Zn-dependent oxidoreductase [Streptomyces sp. Amel2xB2]|uniref:quinone oxidoreductase family protein n=1 Tax=Streptomyces sp. Amel2xB2 TaxID=1305829 RepID=UPI000DBFC024|nr:NADP-dependent oxidoreductase [Streptomyces sp. Amel2xB2]RAJ66633.1 NADPH:quinone reductase-like Zn-dependent oxidoreductase [Streptomyces sp. Amel2xB2]